MELAEEIVVRILEPLRVDLEPWAAKKVTGVPIA
jgi:hypothetical protein